MTRRVNPRARAAAHRAAERMHRALDAGPIPSLPLTAEEREAVAAWDRVQAVLDRVRRDGPARATKAPRTAMDTGRAA